MNAENPAIRSGLLPCGALTEVKSGPAFHKAEGSACVQTVVDALHGAGVCPSIGASPARTTRVRSAILGYG